MTQEPHRHKIRTQPELERIIENKTGFLRNEWHMA
jgi:hypothetical protein